MNDLNKKELALAADMLGKLHDVMARSICNDFEFPEDWTPNEKTQFVKEYHDVNGDPEEYVEGSDYIADFSVVYLLEQKIKGLIND